MSLLSEQEYRRLSGDTRSPWVTTGNSMSASGCLWLAVADVETYLSTFLEPTLIESEEHRVAVYDMVRTGRWLGRVEYVDLGWLRLLTGATYPLTVKFVQQDGKGLETLIEGNVVVVSHKMSRIRVSPCWSACTPCTDASIQVRVSYWSGMTRLPLDFKRSLALLTRRYCKELIYGDGSLDDDVPYGAPLTARTDLGMQRTYTKPRETFFGQSFLGQELEQRFSRYRVIRSSQM